MVDLRGIIPPIITPRGPTGLDRASLARLTGVLIEAGVNGVFVGGSTGEVALLDDATRDAALATVVETAAGRVPVLMGVIDTGTSRVVAHVRRAEQLGADAVVATMPFYVRTTRDEVVAHFEAIAASSSLPVVAYDIPSAVGVRLEVETAAELVSCGLIIAIKDSSGDVAATRRLVELTRDTSVQVLTGADELADAALAFGVSGVVAGLGNVDPHGYVSLYQAARRGDFAAAAAEQQRLNALFAIIRVADQSRIGFTAASIGAFKACARLRVWIDDDRLWPPLAPPNDHERAVLAEHLTAAELS